MQPGASHQNHIDTLNDRSRLFMLCHHLHTVKSAGHETKDEDDAPWRHEEEVSRFEDGLHRRWSDV